MKSCRSLGALLTIGLIVGAAGTARATIVYNFDGPSEQGWTDVLVSAVADANTDWDAVDTDTFAGRDPQAGDGWIAAATSGAGGWDQRDGDNDPFVLRSPTFYLDNSGDLTFYFQGGQQGGAAPANFSGLGGTGFLGLALREEATGNYVLSEHRGSNDDGWVAKSFTAGQLAPFVGGQYTLDMIDDKKGGWGWGGLDTVEIPGTSLPPSTPGATLFWDGSAGNWTNPVWLDDVPGTGSNTGTYPQDIASVVNPANITEGAVTVNSNEEAYSLTMDTGTNGSGGRPGNGTLNITSNTLTIHDDATLSNTSTVNISPGATLDVLGTLTIDPTATFDDSGTANAVALAGAGTATLNANSKLKAGGGSLGAITLTGNAEVETGGTVTIGQLTLPASTTITKSGGGTLDVTGAITLLAGQIYNPTSGILKLSGVVGGSTGLTKNGGGTLELANNNDYTGVTTVNSGILLITNGGALGDTTSGTVVSNGGQLRLQGGITTPGGEPISINGGANGGAIYNQSSDNNIDGQVTLTGGSTIRVDNNRLRLRGGLDLVNHALQINTDGGTAAEINSNPITGTGTLTKEGDGTLDIRTNSPAYTGQVNINNGVIDVNNQPQGLGTGSMNIDGDATLRLRDGVNLVKNITLNGTANGGNGENEGRIRNDAGNNTLSGTIAVNSNSRIDTDGGTSLTLSGVVSGGGTIEKVDSGRLILTNAANSYASVVLNGGSIRIANAGALGGTTTLGVDGGESLEFDGTMTIGLSKLGVDDGTLSAISGTTTVTAPIDLGVKGDVTFTGDGDIVVTQGFGNGSAPVTPDALSHFGFHNDSTSQLYVQNNGGVIMGGVSATGDPATHANFEGHGLLTNGPGGRGLDFNNDTDFRAVPASIQDDASGDGFVIDQGNNYLNLFWGTLTVTAGTAGTWTFDAQANDDQNGFWIDLDRDGIFESTRGGLGDSQGPTDEQITWDDNNARTVTLAEGEYMVAFTHREGSGGSQIDFEFKNDTSHTSLTDIRPGDPSQAGMWTPLDSVTTTGDGGTPTFTEAQLTPDNNLVKTGSGTLTLQGANTYNGTTSIRAGTLVATNNTSLGTPDGGTSVASGATLALQDTSGPVTITNEALTLDGLGAPGRPGALANLGGNNRVEGTAGIQAAQRSLGEIGIGSQADTLTVATDIDLQYSKLVVNGDGNTTITGAISGQGVGSTTRLVDFDGGFAGAGGELNIFSHDSAAIVADTLQLTDNTNNQRGSAWHTTKQPVGNGFVSEFSFEFTNPNNNGADGLAFIVHNHPSGASLDLDGEVEHGLGGNDLTLTFDSWNGGGSNSRYEIWFNDAMQASLEPGFDLSGSGPHDVRVAYVPGDLDVLFDGTPVFQNIAVDLATVGAVDPSGEGWMGFASRTGGANEFHNVSRWYVEAGFDTDNSLIKNGAGILTLGGNNTYNGTTEVRAGTLLVNGTTSGQGNYEVFSDATLGGNGTIGLATGASVNVHDGGDLAPGASIGALTVNGNLSFSQDAALVIEVMDSVPGTGHDQIVFGGDLLELGGAFLEVEALFAPGPLPIGEIVIIDILNPDAILTGLFRDPNTQIPLDEGAEVTDLTGRYSWTLTYEGGDDGKDVVLVDTIPEPATLALLGLGGLRLARRCMRPNPTPRHPPPAPRPPAEPLSHGHDRRTARGPARGPARPRPLPAPPPTGPGLLSRPAKGTAWRC